jgi:DNA-binding GntR family transcriptional regulator
MSVDHESETPVYQQVAAFLRARIEAGELTRRVPSVKTITQEYGIAGGTAEKALGVLRTEGLIRPVIGRGYFVVPDNQRGS